jgi:hypothetical protein
MDLLMKNELRTLVEKQKSWCVSIFMPAHRAKPETKQDPIRFKNLLRQAERQLQTAGLRALKIKELLKPAQQLLNNSFFWEYQSDGLAVFISSEISKSYRLPIRFKKLVVVSERFHIKPLLQLFSADGRFYIFALSQKQVRLLQGTHYSATEVELEGIPKSIADVLKYYETEKQLQFHTRTPGKTGRRAAIFHGHGAGKDDAKKNILLYFQQINKGLHTLLREEQAPLVLAGVDYLLSIYKEASTYPYLIDQVVKGNPENLSPAELHTRAWPIVKSLFSQAQEQAVTRYRRLVGTKRASHDLKVIIPAAYHGRVETLFTTVGIQRWGVFNANTNAIHFHRNARPGDGDLMDLAAVYALLNGGTVYAVAPKRMPEATLVAAIFRY